MDKKTIDQLFELLSRVDLKGGEVPVFNVIISQLRSLRDKIDIEPKQPKKPKIIKQSK